MTFTAFVVPDANGATLSTLDITPNWYRKSIRGGCLAAEFSVAGERNQLWLCADLLGREIQIYDERNQVAWWGMVHEVRINIDGTLFGFSLENVANRIAVAYSIDLADGSSDRATTSWASNTDSVNRFGQKELLHSIGDGSAELAAAAQARLLADMAWPHGIVSFEGQPGNRATLICVGWWETLKWRYFTRLEGRIEFEGESPGISQAIGWGSTSSLLNFRGTSTTYTRTVTNATNATPIVVTTSINHGCNNGDTVTISGVGGNTAANGTFKVAAVAANTFALTDVSTGSNIAGSGAYTSGGTMSRTITHSSGPKIAWGKPITAATNATPIVVTCANHGFSNGTIVTIADVEGNTAANGTFKVASAATNTFALTDVDFGTNIAGNGEWACGGVVSSDAVAGPFGDLVSGQVIAVTGSGSNNGSHTLLANAYNDGKTMDVLTSLTTEVAGASVTVTLTGVKTGQRYVQSHAFDLWRVGIKAAKVGSPTDSLRVDLMTESAGSPSGTVVATCSIDGADMDSTSTWYWINGLTNPSLTASSAYWLIVYRSGSVSDTDYYLLELDEVAYETCKAYNGSAWVAQPNSQYMPFRVWGWEDTINQVKRILSDCGALLTGGQDIAITSSVKSNQYRSGDNTAYDEIMKLLDIGNSSGLRFVVSVTPDRTVRITTEPTASEAVDNLGDKNQIRLAAGGGLRARGDLPVGEWLAIEKAPLHLNALYSISPQFIDEAEYTIDRDVMRLVPKRAI